MTRAARVLWHLHRAATPAALACGTVLGTRLGFGAPEVDFGIVTSPDGRTIYHGAHQTDANIWRVDLPKAVEK